MKSFFTVLVLLGVLGFAALNLSVVGTMVYVLGVVAAFAQITGAIALTPVFLWVAFGIAVAALGLLVAASAMAARCTVSDCACGALDTLLVGILGTILLSVVLLAVGIVATSLISAILVGLLVGAFTLVFTGGACYVRYLTGCRD